MKLMVIDGNSIVNRAFYGIRMLTTRDGTPTNAVYGFINILMKIVGEENPDALCVTFDLKGPTFRHEMYAEYKAQRKPMPEELAVQIPILKDVLDAMNIPRYELSGWEADDLIGTISKKCETDMFECIIVTGDKDSFQLMTDTTHVKHVKSRMGQTETNDYTKEVFEAEYGFEPKKIIDLKALMGDASDNIPGVSGVGEKTALDLVQRFGAVSEIYEYIDALDIKDSVRKKLAAGEESARMSYDLATINCDAPIEFSPRDNLRREADSKALYDIFQNLEFSKFIERFGLTKKQSDDTAAKQSEAEYKSVLIDSGELLKKAIKTLEISDFVSVRHNDDFSVVVAISEDAAHIFTRDDTPEFERALAGIFGESVKKIGHDIKQTQRVLLDKGILSTGWIFDCALAAYLLEPTDNSYELGRLSARYCGYSLLEDDDNGQISMLDERDPADILKNEAAVVISLKEKLEIMLDELSMKKLFDEIEIPLCEVLASMEHYGFYVDQRALTAFGQYLSERILKLEQDIYELAGEEFNINSPKQLGVILFDILMLPAPKKTKTGYSTNIEVLEKLQGKHPIIKYIIEYRQLAKLKSTYADGLLKVICADGRIHTKFQMTVTATGRLSSVEPNMQNIPVRTDLGGEIRKMFVATDGNVLVDADYSQIELRLLAHISGDETMRRAFIEEDDIHTVTASQVFDTPLEEVLPVQRSRAKAVNFGIVYGISAFSLSQDINVSVAEAKQYIESYLEKYSGVRDYMNEIVKKAKEDGYVSTLFGRRRSLPELKSSNYNLRSFGERVALNMPIQGTAADIMKIAMINVYNRLKNEGLAAKIILQVHDELIIEGPESEAEVVSVLLKEEMENAAALSIPLTVQTHVGKSWHEAK